MMLTINIRKNLLKLRYFQKNINTPEDLDAGASAHTEVNNDQDTVATDYPEGPEDLDPDSSFLPEVPEDNEVLGSGARYEEKTQKDSDYDMTMDLDVANFDKNEKKTWSTIYKVIDERYFVEVKRFTREFINICRKDPNYLQKIPTDTMKNL